MLQTYIPPPNVDAFGLFTEFFGGNKTTADKKLPKGKYRIVVFSDPTNKDTIVNSTHVMRQEADGTWSSKNGDGPKYLGISDPVAFYNSHYNQQGQFKDLKIRYYEMPGKLLKGK